MRLFFFLFCSDRSSGLDLNILEGEEKKQKTGDPYLFAGSEDPFCVFTIVYISGFRFSIF